MRTLAALLLCLTALGCTPEPVWDPLGMSPTSAPSITFGECNGGVCSGGCRSVVSFVTSGTPAVWPQ